jgi:copper chaperone CopZ
LVHVLQSFLDQQSSALSWGRGNAYAARRKEVRARMNEPTYLHILDGRLRIKVPEVKGSPLKAGEVEEALQRIGAVTHVKANPTTGNVLILFEADKTNQDQILETLRSLNCLQRNGASSHQTAKVVGVVAQVFLQQAFDVAVKRMMLALI